MACVLALLAIGAVLPSPASAVSNGTVVDDATYASEWSYVVSVVSVAPNGVYECTGSLLAPQLVLTAGHCLDPAPTYVRAFSPTLKTMVRDDVTSFERNPMYAGPGPGDTALLTLANPVSWASFPHVLTSAENSALASVQSARFAGFGLTETGSASTLVAATGDVSRSGSAMWQRSGSTNVCNGDSGGPLVVSLPSGPTIIGTVSFGSAAGCGSANATAQWVNSGSDAWVQYKVNGGPPPAARGTLVKSVSPVSGQAPLTVTFDLTGSSFSDGRAVTYYVDPTYDANRPDLPSGNKMESSSPVVSFTYTTAGSFSALVAIVDAGRTSSAAELVTITVGAPPPPPDPVMVYAVSPRSGTAPLTVDIDFAGSIGGTRFYADPTYPSADAGAGWSDNAVITDGLIHTTFTYTVPGTYTVYVSMDRADGSYDEAFVPITVTAPPKVFTFSGFAQPVDAAPTVNRLKGGSTVPVKWSIRDQGAEVSRLDAVAAGYPKATQTNCQSGSAYDEVETTTTGGTALRYDSSAHQYVFNWQTPKSPGTCWSLDVKLSDGSRYTAFFALR